MYMYTFGDVEWFPVFWLQANILLLLNPLELLTKTLYIVCGHFVCLQVVSSAMTLDQRFFIHDFTVNHNCFVTELTKSHDALYM